MKRETWRKKGLCGSGGCLLRLIHTLGLYWLFYRLTLSLSRKKKKNSPCTAPPINNTARCEKDQQQQQQQRRIERNGQKNKSFFFPTALAYTFITIINIAFFFFVWFFSCLPAPPSSTAVLVKSSLYVEEFRLENWWGTFHSERTRIGVYSECVKTGGTGSGILTKQFFVSFSNHFIVDLSMKCQKHQTRNFGCSNFKKVLRNSSWEKNPDFPDLNISRR